MVQEERQMLKKCAIVAALGLVLAPGAARADWLFTPNIGAGFGGDASGREHLTYGASIGWMGAGIFGWEADFAYTPEFFQGDDDDVELFSDSNVTSFMANVLVGVPVGGQTGGGFRPYVTGGIGVMQTSLGEADDLFEVDNSEFGFNLGAGAIGFASDHIGFRGDVRYYRSFEDPDEDNEFDIGIGNFDFWRGTAGVTFRW
jgi:opacity protein-like surface antigen